ncbi:hypothetical protein BT96DRAFT_993904 [Gymnopus androsaceus JB14]|uniref:Transcription factor IIIC 90kDa subunit N-terminal domain-containing protein n=1 Tax=Gymnopus androsaceus JB14 TaxID=1447944 RepID=A0A6A4HL05_9AGAR|nr:hypothetical protein BT96DRAFT_993904 [Gymnopus androsaceus JB14]
MEFVPVYTSLNVPTAITSPSINCIQWSEDGQAIFTSKSAVYIMTPEPGINFDTTMVLRSSVDEDTDDRPTLGWFRTLIQFDKTDACRWTDHSQDWSVISLGAMDISVWAMTLSPSNVTPDAGCILAVKNSLKGEWKKITNVTNVLLELFMQDESFSSTAGTIAAQTLCIAWSTQAKFLLSPEPELDASLLVCGNRAGDLIFIKYHPYEENKIRIQCKLSVTDRWITHVAFSQWELIEPMTCVALVAYSTPNGSIGIVKVEQSLQANMKTSSFGLPFTLSTSFERVETKISDACQGTLTALKWIDIPGRSRILVYGRPGTIHFWSEPSSPSTSSVDVPTYWSGLHSIRLKTQKTSIGSTSLQPLSGMQYIRHLDALLVCLVDGSFHVVYGIAAAGPVLDSPPASSSIPTPLEEGSNLKSATLSTTVRGVFARVERELKVTSSDVMKINGMVLYDDGFGSRDDAKSLVCRATRPADFSYKHDAKHNSLFTVARIWDDVSDESILKTLGDILKHSKVGSAPLHYLRPVLFHLRKHPILFRLHSPLIKMLGIRNSEAEDGDHTMNIHLDQMQEDTLDDSLRQDFRNSLKRHLFGYNELLLLRMRLSLADFAWKFSSDAKQADFGSVAHGLLNAISHRNLRALIRHLIAMAGAFTYDEIPFVLRLVVQSTLPGSPENLSCRGEKVIRHCKTDCTGRRAR